MPASSGHTVPLIAVARADANRIEYRVDFEYRLPGAAKPEVQWQDTVQLIHAGDAWLVDDVTHGGDWAFSSKGSVRAHLLPFAALCTTP
jgi:putative lipoic acid-binding regulatory protein